MSTAVATPLSPLTLQPVQCAAVACVWLWCCCILAGVRGQLPTYALPRHLDLHSSWRPGYMSRDSPSGGRAGNRFPVLVKRLMWLCLLERLKP
jgi:hypothetical protein